MVAPTRAEFLRAAGLTVAGASAAAVAGCAPAPTPPPIAGEPPATRAEASESVRLLAGLLDRSHHAIAAYTAGIPLLSGMPLLAARHFLGQELGHASELSDLITRGGGRPAEFRAGAYDLGQPRHAADVLALLRAVEQASIGAHLDALPRLSPGPLRSTLGAILANDAQHLSLLRAASGRAALPAPFVTEPAPKGTQ